MNGKLDRVHARTALGRYGVAAAAFCLAAPLVAQAQSNVTLYGIVDAGVVAANRGNGQKVNMVASGVAAGPRWGMRGVEDLGGGFLALFNLEAGFDVDTGAASNFFPDITTARPGAPNGTSTTGFNRRSFVGVGTPFGEFHFGRDYAPFFYAGLQPDILGYGYFGNIQSLLNYTGTAERLARFSNGVNYVSPALSGFRSRVMYSLGETTGLSGSPPRRAGDFWGIGGEYSGNELEASAAYQSRRQAVVAGTPAAFTGTTMEVHDWVVGGRYTFGPAAVAAGHWRGSNPWNARLTWAGVKYRFGANTVNIQVLRGLQANPAGAEKKATTYALAFTHDLSKRTQLYASWGRVNNGPTSTASLYGSTTVIAAAGPGADPQAIGMGVRHAF